MDISFHKRFDRRFAKLAFKVQQKTVERIELFKYEPFARILNNHALTGKWTGYRSIDITGDYHAIYSPASEHLAKFYTVDTHSNLYG